MSSSPNKEIKFSNPGTYHVRVLGNVSQELWEYFKGEVEHVSTNEVGQVVHVLKFHVHDQVELSGVIDALFRQRHVLLSIQRDDQTEEESTFV